ncbi:MAG: hypothetical protein FJZ87_02800 [Chloroflexi bacterium]|nr:hypothetical protein [Chloroflexota bacterium]
MNRSLNLNFQLTPFLERTALKRGAIFGGILIAALLAFEVFNFGTTSFALQDMLGDLAFAGVRWSTVLALAFCGIDFAGIARIFTPEKGRDEPAEVYYLFGAWLLAASFNASLTWWGVSVAILNHNAAGGVLLGQQTMTKFVPVFVAAMVWLVRVLIIGTFSVAGERLFTLADARHGQFNYRNHPAPQAAPNPAFKRPAPRPETAYNVNRPKVEPSYHPVGMSAMSRSDRGAPSLRS